MFGLQEPLFPFFLPFLLFVLQTSGISSSPPHALLLSRQPSRRENKALRYKYFALCIISIELSGLSIRPKLPRNPNRRRLHGRRPCTVRVQRPPPQAATAASRFNIRYSLANLSDHSFTISPINCNQSPPEKPINEFVPEWN